MSEPKKQPAPAPAPQNKLPGKPVAPPKGTPLTDRIENKRVINRLIDFFETKA
jgi:hypothetical protein